MIEGGVLLFEIGTGDGNHLGQVAQDVQIVVAAVEENVVLKVAIARHGIGVEGFDFRFDSQIIDTVAFKTALHTRQTGVQVAHQPQTNCTIALLFRCESVGFGEGIDVAFETACLCRSQAEAVYRLLYCLGRLSCLTSVERRGQFLKRTNELCISLGFGGELRLHLVVRQKIIVEQSIEVGGLPAGVGEVESMVVLLRIEH